MDCCPISQTENEGPEWGGVRGDAQRGRGVGRQVLLLQMRRPFLRATPPHLSKEGAELRDWANDGQSSPLLSFCAPPTSPSLPILSFPSLCTNQVSTKK